MRNKAIFIAGCVVLAATLGGPAHTAPATLLPPLDPQAPLSVMTYNVEGLPWPVRWGRGAALESIGERLAWLRQRGRQPHVVALQEAFSDDAKAIGKAAGYANVVAGPSATERDGGNVSDWRFIDAERWVKGETEGKVLDSGLLILSDYPVVRVRRMAFPAGACAGYDCLANKGAVMVTVKIPGVSTPVDIVDTHLNSRHASGVPDLRSNAAYARQTAVLGKFLSANHDPATPLLVAGDFNMGPRPVRRAALLAALEPTSGVTPGSSVRDGLSGCLARSDAAVGDPADARWILRRGRDWQFIGNGTAATLAPRDATVLFGREPGGAMLSDHMGFEVTYRVAKPAA